jgi:hypothetical protein
LAYARAGAHPESLQYAGSSFTFLGSYSKPPLMSRSWRT